MSILDRLKARLPKAEAEPQAGSLHEALRLLRELGVNPAPGQTEGVYATFPFRQAQGARITKSVKVVTTIGPPMPWMKGFKPKVVESIGPPCILGIEPWCWVQKHVDPSIAYDILPAYFENVHVKVWRLKIIGNVHTKFSNNSQEGYSWEENVRTGLQRKIEAATGSADLGGGAAEQIIHKELNQLVSQLQHNLNTTFPGDGLHVEGKFERTGWGFVKALWEYFSTGGINAIAHYDITLTYPDPFNGTRQIDEHREMELAAPVNGGLSWDVNPF